MIDELHITALGVIEDVTLRLSPGLTVVTGETGAGKTMVVTALQLLLGARADTTLVRAGHERALVEARIRPAPSTARDWIEGDDELVVSREIAAEGRSRVRIDGRLATVTALTEILGAVVEVHAQHEHVELARPERQRTLLDRFAGAAHGRILDRYQEAYSRWQDTAQRLEALRERARDRAREIDRLEFEVDEINRAALDPEVDVHLDDELELLEHGEELVLAAQEAAAALGSEGAGEPLGRTVQALRRVHVSDRQLADVRDRAEALVAEATELARDVRALAERIEVDPEHLEELRERSRLIAQLQRKYGDDVAGILGYAEEARLRLSTLKAETDEVETLLAQLEASEHEVRSLIDDLRRGRLVAADALAPAVDVHLAALGMPAAHFEVDVAEADAPGPHGGDRITFLLAPNPGDPPRPLGRAASGGERSRVALALEVALADVVEADVLVFDEVDAGVGGATAMAVGEKLARLAAGAAGRQVLCVTHLAQLAAFADVHHVVEKGLDGGRAVTTAREVHRDDRAAELSRMLGGHADRAEGLEHARVLLEEAAARRAG
ncbi:MAG: DNA repair protein RecN [Actinobacteria bacterium]|nr:DNA repair protein RecN [Actinomycetota bacterium]